MIYVSQFLFVIELDHTLSQPYIASHQPSLEVGLDEIIVEGKSPCGQVDLLKEIDS